MLCGLVCHVVRIDSQMLFIYMHPVLRSTYERCSCTCTYVYTSAYPGEHKFVHVFLQANVVPNIHITAVDAIRMCFTTLVTVNLLQQRPRHPHGRQSIARR